MEMGESGKMPINDNRIYRVRNAKIILGNNSWQPADESAEELHLLFVLGILEADTDA